MLIQTGGPASRIRPISYVRFNLSRRPTKPRPGRIFPFASPLRPPPPFKSRCFRHRLPSRSRPWPPPFLFPFPFLRSPIPKPYLPQTRGGGGGDCWVSLVMGCFLSCFRGGSSPSGDLRVSKSTCDLSNLAVLHFYFCFGSGAGGSGDIESVCLFAFFRTRS